MKDGSLVLCSSLLVTLSPKRWLNHDFFGKMDATWTGLQRARLALSGASRAFWSGCPARRHGDVELAPAAGADVNGAPRPALRALQSPASSGSGRRLRRRHRRSAPSRPGAPDPRAGLARGGAPRLQPPGAPGAEERRHSSGPGSAEPRPTHRGDGSFLPPHRPQRRAQRPARAGEPPPFPSPLRTSACVPATTGGHLTPPLC